MSETRVSGPPTGGVWSVRTARLRVVRGPDKGKELELGERKSALIGSDPDADLLLSDDTVSRQHAELRVTPRGWMVRDLGSTNGVFVGEVRVLEALLDERNRRLSLGETELEFRLGQDLEQPLSDRPFGPLIGGSPAMRRLFALCEQAAPSDSTVLIEGESGTGKEAVAHSLHRASPRAEAPFVVIDCAALAPGVIESELFGHEKGAFTGAVRTRAGAFEEASGGTLLLDEIGELPLELQPKLLRALEGREIRRVGTARPQPVDVRVLAATHRKLERCVAEGRFRADLYYRLAVIRVVVPPLRHRLEDVVPLARHFLAQLRPERPPEALLSNAVCAALTAHQWPGNVRELRNVIERLALVGELATDVRERPMSALPYHDARQEAIERFEREYCATLLGMCGGVVARAAERAGISRQMFHRLLRKYDHADD